MSPSSKAWRICDVNKRPGAREESFRLTTEKMVSFFARGPYCFRGKARCIWLRIAASGEAAAKVRRDDAARAQALANVFDGWLRNRTPHRPAPSRWARHVLRPHSATRAARGASQRGPGWACCASKICCCTSATTSHFNQRRWGALCSWACCSMRRTKKVLTEL